MPGRQLATVLLTALALSAASAAAPPIRLADVEVLVGVEDAAGAPVTGLTVADFELLIDGAPVTLSSFRPGPAAVSLALLTDVSASSYLVNAFGEARSDFLTIAVPKFFVPALSTEDRVRLGTFARRIDIGQAMSPGDPAFVRAIEAALNPPAENRAGPSPIWDAVDTTIKTLEGDQGRRAVLLMTDGQVTGSRISAAEVTTRALASGVVIDVIGFSQEQFIPQGTTSDGRLMGARIRPDTLVRQLAAITGGRYLPIELRMNFAPTVVPSGTGTGFQIKATNWPPQVGPLFARMVTGLKHMYSLGVTPPVADGRFHQVDVRVRRAGVDVRVRRGFLAPASGGTP